MRKRGLLVGLVVLACALLVAKFAAAAVTVTPASGGTNISADNAANATTPAWTTLGNIVMPQAFRAVIPPLASVYIALAKNTSVAAAFGITELTFQLSRMNDAHVASIPVLFFTIAGCYILIVWVLSAISATLERQVATSR